MNIHLSNLVQPYLGDDLLLLLGFDSHYFLLTRADSINTPPLHPVIFWMWGRREGAVFVFILRSIHLVELKSIAIGFSF